MDVFVTKRIADDSVVGSVVRCKVRVRWLKLEHKREMSIKANNKTPNLKR